MCDTVSTHKVLSTGTVTFLFTDIVGSSPHWEHHPDRMSEALQIHNTDYTTTYLV